MIYYVNAYAPDTYALHITTARVRELDPAAVIYIASDPAAPVTDTIPGTIPITPQYPRGGNLRHPQCALGMLQTMAAILQHHGALHIVKLDADTYLNSIAWLNPDRYRIDHRGENPDMVAMERNTPFSESGDCYLLSIYGIRAAIKGLRARMADAAAHGAPPEQLPEDVTVTNLILQAQLPVHRIPYFHGLHRGLSFRLPDDRHTRAAVIHAGEPLQNGTRAPREYVYLRLQTLWRHTHPATTPIPGMP